MMNLKTSVFSILAISFLGIFANRVVGQEPDPKVMALGKTTYSTCFACHFSDGKGLPVGDKKMAPPLVDSPYVLGDPSLLALIILKGVAKQDEKWVGIMAPLEAVLDDKKIAAVMTYVRNTFGNKAPPVSEAVVKAARAKYSKISSSVKRSTIEKLLAKSKKEADSDKTSDAAAEKTAAADAAATKAQAAEEAAVDAAQKAAAAAGKGATKGN